MSVSLHGGLAGRMWLEQCQVQFLEKSRKTRLCRSVIRQNPAEGTGNDILIVTVTTTIIIVTITTISVSLMMKKVKGRRSTFHSAAVLFRPILLKCQRRSRFLAWGSRKPDLSIFWKRRAPSGLQCCVRVPVSGSTAYIAEYHNECRFRWRVRFEETTVPRYVWEYISDCRIYRDVTLVNSIAKTRLRSDGSRFYVQSGILVLKTALLSGVK